MVIPGEVVVRKNAHDEKLNIFECKAIESRKKYEVCRFCELTWKKLAQERC